MSSPKDNDDKDRPGRVRDVLAAAQTVDLGRNDFPPAAHFDVEEFNERFAFVILGGRAAVIDEAKAVGAKTAPAKEYIRFLTIDALERLLANRLYRQGDRRISAARLWMEHPDRRQYEGLIFDPSRPADGADRSGYYNLWHGFSVEPDPGGSCAIFLDHLRTNVANGDEDHSRYIVAWLAHLLQKPTERVGIALVLRGRQGPSRTGAVADGTRKRARSSRLSRLLRPAWNSAQEVLGTVWHRTAQARSGSEPGSPPCKR
ncbi:MAG: hypothetical protein WD470_03240 [Rhodospirillaceae bacterium]